MSTADPTVAVLAEMRRARQRKRMANIHWVDALYHVYLAAIVGLVIIVFLSGASGGVPLDAHGIAEVVDRGPAFLGLLPAAAVLVGLRSGSRGGPLALEQPDVRHVLMSPVPRFAALRIPVVRQLRFFAFLGIVIGGASGLFARHRLGANPATLIACGAGFGLMTVLFGIGCALIASGRHIPRWLATLVGLVVVAWSIGDVAGNLPTAPMTFAGRLALWPLHMDPIAIAPAVVAVLLAIIGVVGIAGMSIEMAERRTRLVGQLRFAVTLQDLRTVLVLRRQLAQELPRERPWIGDGTYKRSPRWGVWSRGWRSINRFPASRLVRLVIVAVVAGFSARAVWDGTLPMVVVAGLALWIAGLDAIEPLSQETDHPTRAENYPCDIGELMVRHLPVSAVVMVFVSLVASAVFVLAGPTTDSLRIAAIALIPMALAGMTGAVVSALMGAPSSAAGDMAAALPPEFAGMKNGIRTAWPPALAVLGAMPFLAARVAIQKNVLPWKPAIYVAIAVVAITALAAAWVRYRKDLHEWWDNAMEEANEQRVARGKSSTTSTAKDDESDDDDQYDDDDYEDDEYDDDDDEDEYDDDDEEDEDLR